MDGNPCVILEQQLSTYHQTNSFAHLLCYKKNIQPKRKKHCVCVCVRGHVFGLAKSTHIARFNNVIVIRLNALINTCFRYT